MTEHSRVQLAPWPHYADDEVAAVTAVLRSGKVNYRTGTIGRAFEADYAAVLGVPYALAVANGTVALELAFRALRLGPGDDVIVPARTFIATAAAVARCGARPVVADIDRLSHTLTAETVAAALTPATKAIVAVHIAGWPADMASLLDLARSRGIAVIEDCAQAHGATWRGRPVGAFGDVGCFSFCQDKIISTAGEGGLIATARADLFKRAWSTREHGWDTDLARTEDPDDGFRWLAADFGTNARMTESQAAIGQIQLRKLPIWLTRRRAIAAKLADVVRGLAAVTVPDPAPDIGHAYYRRVLMIEPAALKASWSRNRVLSELDRRGIPARVGACPDITREQAFVSRGWGPARNLPNAAWVGDRSVALPVHPTLTDRDVAMMCETICAVIGEATR